MTCECQDENCGKQHPGNAYPHQLRDALEEVWDDGNAAGLDGWIGPGRGAGEVDDEAIYQRDRVIDKVLKQLS